MKSQIAAFAGLVLFAQVAFGQPAPPADPTLGFFYFENTNWTSWVGNAPLSFTNLSSVPLFSRTALLLDTTNSVPARLNYRVIETNGFTNLTLGGVGALRMEFISGWASADTNQGGSGPGQAGYLVLAGDVSSGASNGAWRLYIDANGTNLTFSAVSNSSETVFANTRISWASNTAHLIGLTYSTSTNSVLYVDGNTAVGAPVSVVPGTNTWTNGFYVGSDASGYEQARGIFSYLQFFNSNCFDSDWSNFFSARYFTNSWMFVSNSYASWVSGGGGPDFSRGPLFPSGSSGCNTNGMPYITNLMAVPQTNSTTTLSMDVQGGTNGVLYDLFATTNLEDSFAGSDWTWLGQVLVCSSYTLSNQPSPSAFYFVKPPFPTMVVAWGDNTYGECNVPAGLTNVAQVAAGHGFSVALKTDGTVVAWGDNTYGQTNVPGGLTNVAAIAAGDYNTVALLKNGTLAQWGSWQSNGYFLAVGSPPTNADFGAVAASLSHDAGLLTNGTVIDWGISGSYGLTVPGGLGAVQGVAVAWDNTLAITNERVTGWGLDDAPTYVLNEVPGTLSNVATVSASALHALALKADGTVVAWGANAEGETNVPSGLGGVFSVAAGAFESLALQDSGNIVSWGNTNIPAGVVPAGMISAKGIAAGYNHNLAICSGYLGPVIGVQPKSVFAAGGGSFVSSVLADGGGTLHYQWQFGGTNVAGATNSNLSFSGTQGTNQGTYDVIISNSFGAVTSSYSVFVLPPQITNTSPAPSTNWINTNSFLLSVSATGFNPSSYPLSYQWSLNGTNISGATASSYSGSYGQDGIFTVTVTNAGGPTPVSWGMYFALPGMVEAWGSDSSGECDRPYTLTNAEGIAAGAYQSVVSLDDGSVVQWGQYSDGTNKFAVTNYSVTTAPPGSNVVAVSAGLGQALALQNNGTVAAWGLTNDPANSVPAGLSNVTAIACGWKFNLALSNGTVIAWGNNSSGQTNVPGGLTNVSAIAAGTNFGMALSSSGIVLAWGDNSFGQTNVPGTLSNVTAIAAGGNFCLALQTNGMVIEWGAQTNVPSGMSNVLAIAAGLGHSLAEINDGTLVAWGDDTYGQTNVPSFSTNNPYKQILSGLDPLSLISTNIFDQTIAEPPDGLVISSNVPVRLIAAGGTHSLAGIFSPLVQYPVNVSKDLLLIYNTNSADSSNVCFYYLAHRPMVSSANVLGIGCGTTSNYVYVGTNVFLNVLSQIETWLTTNPTIRPSYAVIFQQVPTTIEYGGIGYMGHGIFLTFQYEFNQIGFAPWSTFVTSINMDGVSGTNESFAYVNKLATLASSNSTAGPFITPSASYGNTNWYFDCVGWEYNPSVIVDQGLWAEEGVTNADPSASIFGGNWPIDISHGTNLAAYFTGGYDLSTNYDTNTPIDGAVVFSGNSSWYIMAGVDSANGDITPTSLAAATYIEWFASNAFGGTNYSNTPVGGMAHAQEPYDLDNTYDYYRDWALGRSFAMSAWHSLRNAQFLGAPPYYEGGSVTIVGQVVGDPFVKK